jgi:CubicO group peptidase (beta-lactamase class C family)
MKTRITFVLIAISLLWTPEALAQSESPLKRLDEKSLDAFIARQMKEKGLVGVSLGILRHGNIMLAKGYGKASLEKGTAVNPHTRFAIGSVTKQFTCACILLLAEDGKLSVYDKVNKYYPGLTRAGDITLYDLMAHTSGYPDYYPLDFVDRRMARSAPLDKVIQEYAGGKLDFEPGAQWSYSNTGYLILGRIVEKVTGMPFGQFLERRILRPLEMTDSVFEPGRDAPNLAQGYTAFALGPPEPAVLEANGWIHAAGGLYCSAADLLRWNRALMDGKILKPESYQLMTAPRKLANGKTRPYGCGIGIGIIQRDGETLLRHSGAVSGYLAFNTMIPRTKSAVVLLANADFLDASAINGDILTLLLKEQSGDGAIPNVKGPPPKEMALDLLRQMQKGVIERDKLGKEFSFYLSEERIRSAAPRLKELGEPTEVVVESISERGGMEVALIRLTFKNTKVKAYLYRTPDGKIQEFLLYRG